MDTLPQNAINLIDDFKFGDADYWKKSFKSVLVELDNNITMFQTIYENVYDLDINDDYEYIDFFQISILKNSLYKWEKELKAITIYWINGYTTRSLAR